MSRRLLNSLVITFARLGDGGVVLARPGETLIPPGQRLINPSPATSTQNVHLRRGIASVRRGFSAYLNTVDTKRVNGLFHAVFDNGSADLIRCDEDNIYKESGATWGSALTGATLTGTANDVWCFGMVAKAGGGSPTNQLFLCNGVDNVYSFQAGAGSVASVAAATFSGAKVLVGVGGRLLAMNVKDSGGNRRNQRVQYSIAGDPTNHTGVGSGTVDLLDDPFPIAAANVIGGRVIVYKGNAYGGSITVGTPTGLVNTPYRWDAVRNTGILLPRTLLQIGPGVNFFVGHDGFYLHDGSRTLRPLVETSAPDLLQRINLDALQNAFAFYDPVEREIYVHLPTGSSETPTETWVIDPVRDRLYGPFVYSGAAFTAAVRYQAGVALTWNTLPLPSWDTLPFSAWDTIGLDPGNVQTIYGGASGQTYTDDAGGATSDNGIDISGAWESPTFVPDEQDIVVAPQVFRSVRPHDRFTCQEVVVRYEAQGAWTPTVEVSINDGASWTVISTGTPTPGPPSTGAVRALTYLARINGNSFKFRISGTRAMRLFAVSAELTYAGDERHY